MSAFWQKEEQRAAGDLRGGEERRRGRSYRVALDRCSVLGVSFPITGPHNIHSTVTQCTLSGAGYTAVLTKYVITKLLALLLLPLCSRTRFNRQMDSLVSQASQCRTVKMFCFGDLL